jgi:hypothetical protein
MPLMETIKEKVEKITGWGRPNRREVEAVLRPREPNVFRFADDGERSVSPLRSGSTN